jgi:hypothetical protein
VYRLQFRDDTKLKFHHKTRPGIPTFQVMNHFVVVNILLKDFNSFCS